MGRNPLFDVGFTLQNQREGRRAAEFGGLRISEAAFALFDRGAAEAVTDFWLVAEPDEAEYSMNLVYNGAMFSESTAGRMAEGLQRILASITADSGVSVGSIALGSAEVPPVKSNKVKIDLAFRASATRGSE